MLTNLQPSTPLDILPRPSMIPSFKRVTTKTWQITMVCFHQPIMVPGDRGEDPYYDRRDVMNVKKVAVRKVKV